MKLTAEQLTAVKVGFAEIVCGARAYGSDRNLIREAALGTRERLLQSVRTHRALCESIVPTVVDEMRQWPVTRIAVTLGTPSEMRTVFLPLHEAIAFVEGAPRMIAESLARENVQEAGFNAVLAILAVFERAITPAPNLPPSATKTMPPADDAGNSLN